MRQPIPPAHRKKIAYLRKHDAILGAAMKMLAVSELVRPKNYFETLIEAIVSQQLSVKAADTIFARFAALTPGRKFPTPREVLAIPAARIRACGLSKMKASFIKDLAKKVLDGTVDLKMIDRWSDEEVIAHLVQVKGIGRWTAEMFLIFSLGREDIFSYDDLGLRNAMTKLYGFKKHPTRAQAEKIAARWSPYRSLASRYLWASLRNKQE